MRFANYLRAYAPCPIRLRKPKLVPSKSNRTIHVAPFYMDNHSVPQLENFRLKVFRTVAEHLNFRKAAEHLFLTQPAITLQIKALEEDLGIRLFDRAGSRVCLTLQGSILLAYVNKI